MNVRDKIQRLIDNKPPDQQELLPDEVTRIRGYLSTLNPYISLENNSPNNFKSADSIDDQLVLSLTRRQFDIFKRIGLGRQSKDIAQDLNLSLNTVTTHRKNIIKRLHLKGTGQLQRLAQQHFFSDIMCKDIQKREGS